MNKYRMIISSIVGSQAHGLATPESDFDYRGVFILPTREILSVEAYSKKTKTISWIEGNEDDTLYELGHFLHLATKCNPTILEVFVAPHDPRHQEGADGRALRSLFPYVWNSQGVRDAFRGYGLNQRKKFLENKDDRPRKYATAYLRTLYCGHVLLTTGKLCVNVGDTEVGDTLKRFKAGEYESVGEVIDTCVKWEDKLNEAYDWSERKETDFEMVNEYLLQMRKDYWE